MYIGRYIYTYLQRPRQELGDVAGIVEAAMVRAIERQAHHLQRAGHPHFLDLAALSKPALEVHMLERCERAFDAVSLAVTRKLLGVELAPAPPRCARCLMALGEAGQPCRVRQFRGCAGAWCLRRLVCVRHRAVEQACCVES